MNVHSAVVDVNVIGSGLALYKWRIVEGTCSLIIIIIVWL